MSQILEAFFTALFLPYRTNVGAFPIPENHFWLGYLGHFSCALGKRNEKINYYHWTQLRSFVIH